jgi:hypothetical protein
MKQLLDPPNAARYVGLSVATLAKYRCTSNDGPPFFRSGSRIRYALDDLDAWLDKRRFTSTSEASARRGLAPAAGAA